MKSKLRRHILALGVIVIPFATGTAAAATLTWNAAINTDWDTVTYNWAGFTLWSNSPADDAIFGAAGVGTVNIAPGVTANSATFNAPGFTLIGSPLTLTGACALTTNADAAISAAISGSDGFEKLGAGMLTLTGANNYTGATDVTEGTLRLGDGTTQPTINSTYNIAAGAALKIQYNTNGSSAQTWSKYAGEGKLILATGKSFDFGFGQGALTASFTGTLRIEGGRVHTVGTGNLGLGGTTAVEIAPGGHLGMWNGGTFTMPFTIAGTGYGEGGYEAALRFANSAPRRWKPTAR